MREHNIPKDTKAKSLTRFYRFTPTVWVSISLGILMVILSLVLNAQYSTDTCTEFSQREVNEHSKKVDLGQNYTRIKGCIYYRENIVYGVDPRTFKALENGQAPNSHYGKDKNSAFFRDQKITNVDVKTFELLEKDYFSRDKSTVFYQTHTIHIIDSVSFEIMDYDFAKDKNTIYRLGNFNFAQGIQKIVDVDMATFELLGKDFSKDKNQVYYRGDIIEDSDPETFEILNELFAKDKNFVYKYSNNAYGIAVLENLDVQSFSVINYRFTKDKNFVYQNGIAIEKIDPMTFEVIDTNEDFVKDARHVYYAMHVEVPNSEKSLKKFQKIEGADPFTFVVLDDHVAKDSNSVYRYSYSNGLEKIEAADPVTFEVIDNTFTKDKNSVYKGILQIQRVDPLTIQVLTSNYIKDKDSVFFFPYCHKCDQDIVFDAEIIVGADPATFEVMYPPYSKDKNNVYHYASILEDADPETFTVSE